MRLKEKLEEKGVYWEVERELKQLSLLLSSLQLHFKEKDASSLLLLSSFSSLPSSHNNSHNNNNNNNVNNFNNHNNNHNGINKLQEGGNKREKVGQRDWKNNINNNNNNINNNGKGRKYNKEEEEVIVRLQKRWRGRKRIGKGKMGMEGIVRYYLSHPDKEALDVKKRNKIMGELISTEEEYVSRLFLFISLFLTPLELSSSSSSSSSSSPSPSSPGIDISSLSLSSPSSPLSSWMGAPVVSKEMINNIFGNIKEIYKLNKELLERMKEGYGRWPWQPFLVSQPLLQLFPYFLAYSSYINSFHLSLSSLLSLCKQNKTFDKWYKETEKNERLNRMDFSDYSILPVQRIPRYVLLLDQLYANTSDQHIDKSGLLSALSYARSLADQINERKAMSENMQKVYQIQQSLIGSSIPTLLQSSRSFIRSGQILILSDRIHHRYMILFNDLILITKRSSSPWNHLHSPSSPSSSPSSSSSPPPWSSSSSSLPLCVVDQIIQLKGAAIDDDTPLPNAPPPPLLLSFFFKRRKRGRGRRRRRKKRVCNDRDIEYRGEI